MLTVKTQEVPVFGGNGKLERFVTASHDITEQKKAEEFLLKSEKLAVIGQLAAGVAHEIRNPLASLKGFVQLLKESENSNSFYLNIMMEELNRIDEIVNEFMVLARSQTQNYQPRFIQDIIQTVITLLEKEARMSNVQFLFTSDQNLSLIHCEENRLKQVFINILKNGIEAMPSGGQFLIEIKKKEEKQVVIRFCDQGCGIPKDRISKLGEPFYTTKEKGIGLGLTVSYKIIRDHKGDITITSQLNQGTTVEVTLPIDLS